MKLIDADKILEALGIFTDKKHGDPHFLKGIETAREIVEQMPEAVVRCGKCRYADTGMYTNKNYIVCEYYDRPCINTTDDYCSYGERKSDE